MSNFWEKLEKIIFYFFLFIIPFQTRKFIWAKQWPINEWTSIWLWGTDILIGGLLLLWFLDLRQQKRRAEFWRKNKLWIIISGIFGLIAIPPLFHNFSYLAFFHWLKLSEIILFLLYLKDLSSKKVLSKLWIISILLISGLFQSIIAISQFFNQSNLGLRILGEGILGPNLAGVAKINLNGLKLIRAYGTFPHPNILAFFLLVIILIWLSYLLKNPHWLKKYRLIFSFSALALLWLALFLSFSRATITLAVILTLIFLLWQKKFSLLLWQILLWVCLILSLWPEISIHFLHFSSYHQSISLRLYYQNVAKAIFWFHPWIGVGWGNFVNYFISHYPSQENWIYQPVHSIYWLILSEMGIFGFSIFIWILGRVFGGLLKIKKKSLIQFQLGLLLFLAFLIIGLEDHSFLTTQQGWLIIGIMIIGVAN